MTRVWPALWPPWKRTTMSARSDSQSTILPLPSSPHCDPTTPTFPTKTPPLESQHVRPHGTRPALTVIRLASIRDNDGFAWRRVWPTKTADNPSDSNTIGSRSEAIRASRWANVIRPPGGAVDPQSIRVELGGEVVDCDCRGSPADRRHRQWATPGP